MSAAIQAAIRLEEVLFKARCYCEAMQATAGDEYPSWLFVFKDQLDAIEAALEPLSRAVRPELAMDNPEVGN